jgi:hypothetical protein
MARPLPEESPDVGEQELPSVAAGFVSWLRRRPEALWPTTRRRWAFYGLFLLLALFVLFEWRATITYSAQVIVIERTDELIVGINPTTERLDFGDLTQGSSQVRPLVLENSSVLPQRISIVVTGEIGQFIQISDAFFTLERGETRNVDFTLFVPPNAEPRKYSGRVLVLRAPWSPWP